MTPRGNTNVIGTIDASFVVGATTFSGSFQTIDVKTGGEIDIVRNSVGDTISKNYYDVTERKGTFTFVTVANPFAPPAKGSLGTLTSTVNTEWNNKWIVDDHSVTSTNTGAQRCVLDLSYNSNVQS
jgi:hypothetical protein